MSSSFQFPKNAENGQLEGLNIHGITHFEDYPFYHLAREMIQNALDAVRDEVTPPVIVKFIHQKIDSNVIPDKTGLKTVFDKCSSNPEQSKKDQAFFKKGKEILEKDKIDVLTISDYKTTGLRGVSTDTQEWKKLITESGASNKKEGAGGSYGVGKNAPFACTSLHTIFYTTLNENQEFGFQGVSKLASHMRNEHEQTRGTGYYRKNNRKPVTNFTEINDFFHRFETGTDVHVIGLKYSERWKEEVMKSVLDNFLVAIHEESLEVWVDDEVINHETLDQKVKQHILSDKNLYTYEFLQAYTSEKGVYERIQLENIEGEIDLYIMEGDPKSSSRTVSMFREMGMKIYEQDRFPQTFYFSGLSIVKGNQLNELLRQTEPATHNKWVPSILEEEQDQKYAEEVIKEIKKKIKDRVQDLSKINDQESGDIGGLTDLLPDISDEGNPLGEINDSDLHSDVPRNIKSNERKIRNRKGSKSLKKRSKKKIVGDRQVKDKPERRNRKKQQTKTTVEVDRIRVTMQQGSYLIKVYPKNSGLGHLDVNVIGEDARTYNEPFKNITNKETAQPIPFDENGVIGPITFEKNKPTLLIVNFKDKMRHSLEVLLHED